jgi:hypothetical protein
MSPLSINGSYQTLDYIAGRNRNTQQAAARPARVRFMINVTGSGAAEARLEGLNFGALMLEEPTFSWGLIALEVLPTGSVPLATACILSWQSNDNGIYTGADVGFRMQGDTETRRYKFSLTFEGSTLRSTANTGMNITPEGDIVGVDPSSIFRQ